jgi:hypothetical protein
MSTTATTVDGSRKPLPDHVVRLGWGLLLLGLAIFAAGYGIDARRAAFDNVVLYLFVASMAVGSVFLVALEYIGGAVWSVLMRRVGEFLAGLTPLLPLVALPLFFHLHDLFHWTHLEAVSRDQLLQGKSPYLNVSFFIIRFVIVVAVWTLFFLLFTRNSRKQDSTGDQKLTTWNIRLAALFLPLFAITITITAVDWAMSLEPHWFSTIIGVYYFSGTVLAGVAAVTLVVVYLSEAGILQGIRADHLYSLGALMFAFVNFWAYIAFSQFLLIWYANIPEETFWYMTRWKNGWEYVSVLLIVVHFAVPYFALLAQDAKMDPRRLKVMAIWILAAHILDLYWLVMPTFSGTVSVGWVDLGIPLVAAGLPIVVLAFFMKRIPLVPTGDPKLERALKFRL